jgi:hypothetical protein
VVEMEKNEQIIWDIMTNIMEAGRHGKRKHPYYYTAQEKDVIEIAIKEHSLTEDQAKKSLEALFDYGYVWELPVGTLRVT